jgi:hypothetical protein
MICPRNQPKTAPAHNYATFACLLQAVNVAILLRCSQLATRASPVRLGIFIKYLLIGIYTSREDTGLTKEDREVWNRLQLSPWTSFESALKEIASLSDKRGQNYQTHKDGFF